MVLLTFGVSMKSDAMKMVIIRVISFLCVLFIIGLMLWEMIKVELRGIADTNILCNQVVPEISIFIGFSHRNVDQLFALHKKNGIFAAILPYFLFLVAVALLRAIKITGDMKRPLDTKPEVIFEDVNGANADKSFTSLLKYLVNHGFYNFGKEIVLSMFIVVIFTRLNFFAIFYIAWMVILLPHRFENSERLWKTATASVMVFLIVQCVVIATFVFIEPCKSQSRLKMEAPPIGIVKMFYDNFQPVYEHPETLLCDFILLLLLNCKVSVIRAS